MAMDKALIEKLIKDGIPDAFVEIEDLRGDGEHYAAYVLSPAFADKTKIQQHQMVFAALQGKLGEELQALSLTTAPAKVSTNG